MSWLEQVEEIARHVLALHARRDGRLAAVTVSVPAHVYEEEIAHMLRARLGQEGLTDVEVATCLSDGPLRLVSMELTR